MHLTVEENNKLSPVPSSKEPVLLYLAAVPVHGAYEITERIVWMENYFYKIVFILSSIKWMENAFTLLVDAGEIASSQWHYWTFVLNSSALPFGVRIDNSAANPRRCR